MTIPLLRKRRVLAAKIETTVGAAETLSASDAVFNVYTADVQANIEMTQRMGQGVFGPLPSVAGARGGTATFSLDLIGGETTPAWASTFLPACGFVLDTGVYLPVTRPPGSGGVKTITIGSYQDGLYKVLRGCMGTAVFTFKAGVPVSVLFTFTGIWNPPTDVTIIAPDYPNVLPPRFADSGLLIGSSWNPKIEQLTIDLGNTVVLREDPGDISGYCSAVVTDRLIVGQLNPEAALVAGRDDFGDWLSSEEQAIELSVGEEDNRVAFASPALQFQNVQDADRNSVQINDINFQLNRGTDGGDDELAITID